jgi:ATP-dependent helicase HrpA
MCLHYATLGRCDDLKEDLTQAAFDGVFMERPWPRTAGEFEQRIEEGRARLIPEATALAAKVAETLAEYHAVAKQLSGSVPPHRLRVVTEARDQLAHLVYPGFIARTPRAWLPHLPRYLKALRLRLEKHDRAPEKDRQAAADLARLWEPVRERLDAGSPLTPAQEEFRWHLEELRVSLFAQELKTVVSVSVPRLEKRWREL